MPLYTLLLDSGVTYWLHFLLLCNTCTFCKTTFWIIPRRSLCHSIWRLTMFQFRCESRWVCRKPIVIRISMSSNFGLNRKINFSTILYALKKVNRYIEKKAKKAKKQSTRSGNTDWFWERYILLFRFRSHACDWSLHPRSCFGSFCHAHLVSDLNHIPIFVIQHLTSSDQKYEGSQKNVKLTKK